MSDAQRPPALPAPAPPAPEPLSPELLAPAAPPEEPLDEPPADELEGPPLSEEAAGGQSLLIDELPALPLLGDSDLLPGGQSAAALEELLPGAPLVALDELLSDELVLGELAPGELEYEPFDCAKAPQDSASNAPAVAAASKLSFIG